ncbi:hypothetical protein [Sphingomonas immobilis]|uniref:Uncharacterized protein n=1 Tax=Sphingomonas immobilis TaxID=3063997 RepID=A0ABT8ZX10_9SPHN|nr:hypothetical protein [Sphingomonas sp. CA1-15]MDO7842115.1 hypothetical protein [Sphingomonas sp. CA1-15]
MLVQSRQFGALWLSLGTKTLSHGSAPVLSVAELIDGNLERRCRRLPRCSNKIASRFGVAQIQVEALLVRIDTDIEVKGE